MAFAPRPVHYLSFFLSCCTCWLLAMMDHDMVTGVAAESVLSDNAGVVIMPAKWPWGRLGCESFESG
jgi:hypothetical protein